LAPLLGNALSDANREQLKRDYRGLFDAVSAALVAADPIGLIADGAPVDEYEPEVGTILPRLKDAHDASDVEGILHEEFTRWFGPAVAGARGQYLTASLAVWRVCQSPDQLPDYPITKLPNS
jgi:hypothetical protein